MLRVSSDKYQETLKFENAFKVKCVHDIVSVNKISFSFPQQQILGGLKNLDDLCSLRELLPKGPGIVCSFDT